FQLAGEASSDPLVALGAREAQRDLEAGLPLGPALRRHLLFPELIAWMTEVGERRGGLGKTLHYAAEMYRKQVARRDAPLGTRLIIATAGLIVALFVFALILPMFRLLEGLSK